MWRTACFLMAASAALWAMDECTRGMLVAQPVRASFDTQRVAAGLVGSAKAPARRAASSRELIDRHLFGAMEAAGVRPAAMATDEEFLRRAALDLTGRIPSQARVRAFAFDTRADKRARLVDELLASPEWVDKWSTYFGDLYRNSVNFGRQRYPQERQTMHGWLRTALAANVPYDQVARELITASGENSWEDGRLGFNSWAGIAIQLDQDRVDLQTVHVADAFLGLSHMDCLLCHSGRRRLTGISLWGERFTRFEAQEMAAFFSQSALDIVNRSPVGGPRPSPWSMRDDASRQGYVLNTTTGDRPAREGGIVVAPRYPFSGGTPRSGETYREALAREVTGDFQFARAAVNYLWKELFVVGLVEPANQFDLARLDPDNPPPAPWTLQPSNARLLNELAQRFIDMKFDVKALMRLMATSDAYGLSIRYDGEWKPEYDALYARKFARRLWAEEIHDALVLSSGVPSAYWAMQQAGGSAAGGPGGSGGNFGAPTDGLAGFFDAFLRGNRVDQLRSGEFTLEQALRMMNDPIVLRRVKVSEGRLNQSDAELITDLFRSVLARLPDDAERAKAERMLATGDRAAAASNLMWTLFNKAEFLYNH